MSAALQDLLARLEGAKAKPVAVEVPSVGMLYFMPLTIGAIDRAPQVDDGSRGIVRGLMTRICDENGNLYGPSPELEAALGGVDWDKLKVIEAVLSPKA